MEEILESLSPRSRDRYILANLSQIVGGDSDDDETDLDFDEETDELMDMGVMNRKCCDDPRFVMDENCHDQICTNCGDANHCATLTIGNRCLHFETIAFGRVSVKAVYKRITHFRRYLRDLQGGVVNVPRAIVEDVRRHVPPAPSAEAVLAYLRHRRHMRYYSQARFISQALGNRDECVDLTSDETYQLIRRFMRYSTAFDRYKATGEIKRKNFLSYSFILSKLAGELGYARIVPYIRPLKCAKTRAEQEAIWTKLPLHFYPDAAPFEYARSLLNPPLNW